MKIKPEIDVIILFLLTMIVYILLFNINKIYNCKTYEFLIIFAVSCLVKVKIYKALDKIQ